MGERGLIRGSVLEADTCTGGCPHHKLCHKPASGFSFALQLEVIKFCFYNNKYVLGMSFLFIFCLD